MSDNRTTDYLANNAALTVISRFSMLAATAALPVLGWLLIRGVNSVDDLGHKIDVVHEQVIEANGNVKVVQQTQSMQGTMLLDHETRMRLLERPKSPN